MNQFLEELRNACTNGPVPETPESTNLTLCKDDFVGKLLAEADGRELLELLTSGEVNICLRLGLLSMHEAQDGAMMLEIPRWNAMLAHLRIVASV